MPEPETSLSKAMVDLLATPLAHFSSAFTPGLARALSHTTLFFLYELARKTREHLLEAWGLSEEAVAQAETFLHDLGLTLGLTLTPDALKAIQEATYRHGASRPSRQPAPRPESESGRP